jgi:hypothetical protein
MRRALVAIGSVLLAAALAAGSGANFQSSSANAGNLIKAGVVSVTSTKSGSAVLNVSALAPGHSVYDTVTITNSGDLASSIVLSAANYADTPASPALSNKVDLKIEDTTASTTVYDGKLGAFTSAPAGTFAVGASHSFKFTVTLADGGTGAEDGYQGARTTVDYTWTASPS